MSQNELEFLQSRTEQYTIIVNELANLMEDIALFCDATPEGDTVAPATQLEDIVTVADLRSQFRSILRKEDVLLDNDWFIGLVANIGLYEVLGERGSVKPAWRVEAFETLSKVKKAIDEYNENIKNKLLENLKSQNC